MRAKWSGKRSACTRRGGASSTRNGSAEQDFEREAAPGRLFCFEARLSMVRAGIVGGTGYTGVELLRLLAQHPQVELRAITSRKEAGTPVSALFPSLRRRLDLAFSEPKADALRGCDVVFFATPSGVAMAEARALLPRGTPGVRPSPPFRLQEG